MTEKIDSNISGEPATIEKSQEDLNLLERMGKLSDEDLERVCKKAIKIRREKQVIRNNDGQEAKKGKNRNEICPFCNHKAKNCTCV